METAVVIMLQPLGGMDYSYVSGDEVVVPEYVAQAWGDANIAKRKEGEAGEKALRHPAAVVTMDTETEDLSSSKEPDEDSGGQVEELHHDTEEPVVTPVPAAPGAAIPKSGAKK